MQEERPGKPGNPPGQVKPSEGNGCPLARAFKFYLRNLNPNSNGFGPSLESTPYRSTYNKFKKVFDKLQTLMDKYGLDGIGFVRNCVLRVGVRNPNDLLTTENFKLYASHLKRKEQYAKIHEQYVKTANFIASECLKTNTTPSEYIKMLIVKNRIGLEYVSGRMSKHFIASIQNFKKIYNRLDSINRDELGIICTASDELNQETQRAFKMIEGIEVKPIGYTEAKLNELKLLTNNKNN